jgi:Cof subfamily protein (haloacid dehalogenase superfamily)
MIFLDLDGTLFDDHKNIPEYNTIAIHEALAQGHKVIICTGRPLCSAKRLFPQLGMEQDGCYAITFNGGLIYDIFHEKILFKQSLPSEHAKYLFHKAEEQGIYIQAYSDHTILCPSDRKEGLDYSKRLKIDREIVSDIYKTLDHEASCKALAIVETHKHQRLEDFRKSLSDWSIGKVNMFFSCNEYLEIVPLGISKGDAIRFLADYLNIPIANTIAVGDAENDITMLKAAGLGVAMQNATEEIKQIAGYVTELDNNQGGVGEVIRKFML